MRSITSLAIVGTLLLAPTPATAQVEVIDPATFDSNGDGLLSTDERAALRARVTPDVDEEKAHYLIQLDNLEEKYKTAGVLPLSAFEKPAARPDCDDSQRIFLRREVTEVPVSDCLGLRPKSDGAAFGLVDDRENGATVVQVRGGIGLVLAKSDRFRPYGQSDKRSFGLSDVALVAFTEADGSLGTDGGGKGYLRTGLKVESAFAGAALPLLAVGVMPYMQTDLGGDARAAGLQMNLVPHHPNNHLNGSIRLKDAVTDFRFIARGVVDAFRVDDPGGTGLSDDDYAWIGGRLGLEYEDSRFLEHGWTAAATVDLYRDFAGQQSAVKFTASLNFNLVKGGATALGLEYTRGKNRQDLENEDQISANFKVKF